MLCNVMHGKTMRLCQHGSTLTKRKWKTCRCSMHSKRRKGPKECHVSQIFQAMYVYFYLHLNPKSALQATSKFHSRIWMLRSAFLWSLRRSKQKKGRSRRGTSWKGSKMQKQPNLASYCKCADQAYSLKTYQTSTSYSYFKHHDQNHWPHAMTSNASYNVNSSLDRQFSLPSSPCHTSSKLPQ